MNKTVLLYSISGLSVLALADIYPKLAMFLVGLLIVGVLAVHGDDYAALLNSAQGKK